MDKTTAVDILLGLRRTESGKILTDEMDIQEDYRGWLSHLSYIPQSIYKLDDSIRANATFRFDMEKVNDDEIWETLGGGVA